MSSENFESSSSLQAEDEESILSFHVAEDDDVDTDDNIPEENVIKYQNTYRMESKNPFDKQKATVLMKSVIEKYFDEKTKYDPYQVTKICADLSTDIRNDICDMNFDRYKIVSIVQIVEKKNQGVMSVVRFLRDLKRDMYITSEFENNDLFASVVLVAMYHE